MVRNIGKINTVLKQWGTAKLNLEENVLPLITEAER